MLEVGLEQQSHSLREPEQEVELGIRAPVSLAAMSTSDLSFPRYSGGWSLRGHSLSEY